MKNTDRILIFLFLTYLFGFFILHLVMQDVDFSEEENRVLSTLDDIKVDEFLTGDTARDIEVYIQDQFPLRSLFVEAKTRIDYTMNRTLINGVFISDNNLIQQFNTIDEETYQSNMQTFNNFIAKIEQPFYMMVIPTAAAINEDRLPPYSQNLNEEVLIAQIKEDLKEENFIDVYEDLKAQEDQLYYNSDHHLNAYGSYVTYSVLMNDLSQEVDNFTFEVVSEDFSGSLSSKSGAFWVGDDVIVRPRLSGDIRVQVTYEASDVTDSVFNEDNLLVKDQYTYYLDGNHALVEVETFQEDKQNILVLSDSYGHSLAPYLIANFNKVTFIDLRYYHLPVSEIAQDYDIVLGYYGIDSVVNDTNISWLE